MIAGQYGECFCLALQMELLDKKIHYFDFISYLIRKLSTYQTNFTVLASIIKPKQDTKLLKIKAMSLHCLDAMNSTISFINLTLRSIAYAIRVNAFNPLYD